MAPQIIPNGITESIWGEISNIPLLNNCVFENIYFSFTKSKLYAQVEWVFLFQTCHLSHEFHDGVY